MNTNLSDQSAISTSHNALFSALRVKLAREVSGSAMLADLLEKVNKMQDAQARPAEFKERFDEFVGRAEDYSSAIRPFVPGLVEFLASQQPQNGQTTPLCR